MFSLNIPVTVFVYLVQLSVGPDIFQLKLEVLPVIVHTCPSYEYTRPRS